MEPVLMWHRTSRLRVKLLSLVCAFLAACSPQTYAVGDPSVTDAGIVFDIGGKDDRSFNAAAWNGMTVRGDRKVAQWH